MSDIKSEKNKFVKIVKQHKITSILIAIVLLSVIILPIILAGIKTYKIGDVIKGKYANLTVESVEYTDNAAGNVKPNAGYMFVIFKIRVNNTSEKTYIFHMVILFTRMNKTPINRDIII